MGRPLAHAERERLIEALLDVRREHLRARMVMLEDETTQGEVASTLALIARPLQSVKPAMLQSATKLLGVLDVLAPRPLRVGQERSESGRPGPTAKGDSEHRATLATEDAPESAR